MTKIDTMNTPSTNQNGLENLMVVASQSEFLCYDGCPDDCPAISYEPIVSPNAEHRISKAFDILFQEVMRIRQLKHTNEISSNVRQGFDRPAGRGTNS